MMLSARIAIEWVLNGLEIESGLKIQIKERRIAKSFLFLFQI
jgi:hypothetical protein